MAASHAPQKTERGEDTDVQGYNPEKKTKIVSFLFLKKDRFKGRGRGSDEDRKCQTRNQ